MTRVFFNIEYSAAKGVSKVLAFSAPYKEVIFTQAGCPLSMKLCAINMNISPGQGTDYVYAIFTLLRFVPQKLYIVHTHISGTKLF